MDAKIYRENLAQKNSIAEYHHKTRQIFEKIDLLEGRPQTKLKYLTQLLIGNAFVVLIGIKDPAKVGYIIDSLKEYFTLNNIRCTDNEVIYITQIV